MSTTFNHIPSVPVIRPSCRVDLDHQSYSGPVPLALWRQLGAWLARRRQREALASLADNKHLLDDIGLTRDQALGEADKPFWR